MDWDRYGRNLGDLADMREEASRRRSEDSRRRADVARELGSLQSAVVAQRQKILDLANRARVPRPDLKPQESRRARKFEAAVSEAKQALNSGDRAIAAAELRAKQPFLFPRLPPEARNVCTYLITAVLSSLLAFAVRAIIHLAGQPWPSYTAMWLFLGTPAVAVLAGFTTLRTLGRPQIEEDYTYWAWLFGGCFIAFFVCWIVQVILDQL
jgi:hypothetical protein